MTGVDTLSKSFGLSIAFFIPGALGLYAVSFFVPVVREWFGAAADAQATVGGFLFVMLGSAGMGVFISGIRWLVLESNYGIKYFGWRYAPDPPQGLDLARRKDQACEAAYQDLLFRHYQFYQFYANIPFALALTYVAWAVVSPNATLERGLWLAILMVIADAVLLVSGKHAISRYDYKIRELLGLKDAAA